LIISLRSTSFRLRSASFDPTRRPDEKEVALVKFAPLVFFKEFNGASRGQKQNKKRKEERAKGMVQGLRPFFWKSAIKLILK